MLAVFGRREKPFFDLSSSSPANLSYLLGPGFCIIKWRHWRVQALRRNWIELSMSIFWYFSTETEGQPLQRFFRLLKILRRRGCLPFVREHLAGTGGKGDLDVSERVEILVIEGMRALWLDGLEPAFLGKGPELLWVRPVDYGFHDLLSALHCKGIAGGHLIPDYKL